MRFVGDIALDAEVRAIASGAITDGEPVIVNSTGTVSGVTDALTEAIGTAVVYNAQAVNYNRSVFDSHNNRIVVAYADQASYPYKGTVIVGTVSGTSISYGTEVVFDTGNATFIDIAFDSNSNRVVIAYCDGDNGQYGTAIVGTVDPSDNSISFGTPVVFNGTGKAFSISCTFDSSNNKVVITYRDAGNSHYGTAIVGTVDSSDNSISFGTEVVFNSANTAEQSSTFDNSNNKVVIAYQDQGNNSRGTAIVATVDSSDNSISFGTEVDFAGANNTNQGTPITFDSNSNKIVVLYSDGGDSSYGKAKVGTVSGTGISFGSATAFESSAAVRYKAIDFDSSVNKVVIAYDLNETDLKYVVGTVSSTSISFGTAVVFSTGNGTADGSLDVTYDSSNEKSVIVFRDQSNSNHGTSHVFQNAQSTTLTTENFIGFAHAAYADGQKATVKTTGSIARNIPQQASASTTVGTEVQFEAGDTRNTDATFDSNSNRIVIVYRDAGNSSYGSVVVGTVDPSDNSISFGTPVVFESANSEVGDVVFDSSNNKVVVFYTDNGNSSYGTAIVGTVDSSDNSISFGSATTFLDATSYYYGMDATFDSSNNKIVIAYRDGGDSNKGKAKVGTVSGTSISFGSATEFEAGTTAWIGSTFDTSNNKVVITYQDAGNSDYGTAVVGTVSGTSISFGTPVVFASNASFYTSPVFDSDNSKIVIAYQNNSVSPAQPFAIVGTVSGTSISFGTAVTAGSSFVGIYTHAVYNSNAKKTVVSWSDSSDIKGRFSSLSVSGTSITWDTAALYNNGSSDWNAIAFDSSNNRVVIPWAETAGKAVVVRSLGTAADLTIGQQYFVQTDGTLGTSADDPSVIAGTAIGTSDIIVKG